MNNKKNTSNQFVFLMIIAIFGFVVSSCEKDDDSYFLFPGKTKLDFGYNTNSISLKLSNLDDEKLTYTISSNDDFLAFSDQTGSIEGNGEKYVTISVRRNSITRDSISSSVYLSSSKGQSSNIQVFIRNYPENKIRLSNRVVGSAFDQNRQLLYLLYTNSYEPQLEIYNVSDGVFTTYNLNLDEYSSYGELYLMPDGNNCMIVMRYMLIQFNVNDGEITNSWQFDDYITNVAGSPNQKLYVSVDDYWNSFYSIDLNTGVLTPIDIQSMEGHYIQMHPSWDYLYGIDHYDGLIKIDIRNNPPTMVYSDNQYDGDKLWIVGGGNKIITHEKALLEISPELSGNDIQSSSQVSESDYQYISEVAYDETQDTYFVLFSNSGYYEENSSLHKLNGSLDFIEVIEPEAFMQNDSQGGYNYIDAIVRYVYCNPANNSIVTITTSDSSYPDYTAIEIIKY